MELTDRQNRTFLERIAESQNLVFFGVFVMLIPLMMHTANLLLSVSIIKNTWYAYFFAIGFDLAIFIFAAHGRLTAAGGIAFVVFLLNASVLNLDTLNAKFDPMLVKLMVTLVLSGTSAWILHSYVMMFNEKKTERNKVMDLHQQIFERDKQITAMQNEAQHNKQIIEELTGKLKDIETIQLATEIAKKSSKETITKEVDSRCVIVGSNVVCRFCQNSFDSKDKFNMYTEKFCTRKECKTVTKEEPENELAS